MATTPPSGTDRGPLSGLVVVDCSTVLAGPFCTMLLADLGADVVKVEPPDGDATRTWGPPWVGDDAVGTRTAAYFLAVNRNKRSIRLDLRTAAGAAVLRRLLGRADVFVENFRPGSLDRLGFDEASLTRLNPGLVHLAISGYGTTGAAAARPGYDAVVQAMGGLMSITGAPDEAGGEPTKVGVAISDVVSGLFGAVAVLAGLIERGGLQRDGRGGAGQRIEVSLLASTMAVLVNQAQNAFVTAAAPRRHGNAHPNIVPYQTFATADGHLVVAVGSERQWRSLCAALALDELDDPRFATNGGRVEHRDEVLPILAACFAGRSTGEWERILEDAEVPFGPIRDVLEAFDSPEASALDMSVDIEHPAFGVVRQAGIPIRFERTPGAIRTAPPLVGEHTDDVLLELGYDTTTIAEMHETGVV